MALRETACVPQDRINTKPVLLYPTYFKCKVIKTSLSPSNSISRGMEWMAHCDCRLASFHWSTSMHTNLLQSKCAQEAHHSHLEFWYYFLLCGCLERHYNVSTTFSFCTHFTQFLFPIVYNMIYCCRSLGSVLVQHECVLSCSMKC